MFYQGKGIVVEDGVAVDGAEVGRAVGVRWWSEDGAGKRLDGDGVTRLGRSRRCFGLG